jgi:hypothetical protein
MAIKLKHSSSFSTYFITFTCLKWISLFEITNTCNMVYKWFAQSGAGLCPDATRYQSFVLISSTIFSACNFSKYKNVIALVWRIIGG